MDDEALVFASQQGNLEAFNDLVLKYQDQVFGLASYILENQDLAEDITQEAFLKAYQKINRCRGSSFRAWLLKIAKNLCFDEMRSWKRLSRHELEPSNRDGEINESPDWLIDPLPLPEEVAEAGGLQRAIEKGLSQLPPLFRTVVILVDVYQMDYRDAAKVTGVPMGTLKSRLARGRMQLRDFLCDVANAYLPERGVSPKYASVEEVQMLQVRS